MKLSPEVQNRKEKIARAMFEEFQIAPEGSKSDCVDRLAKKYHVSFATVYNYIKKAKSL